jgi:hypothetical protein
MFEWLTIDLLRLMTIGAIVGAGLRLGYFLWRDREYQAQRWRNRNRPVGAGALPVEDLGESDGYQPHAITPEDRAALPEQVFLFASLGAIAAATTHSPEIRPQHLFALLAAHTLAADFAAAVGTGLLRLHGVRVQGAVGVAGC